MTSSSILCAHLDILDMLFGAGARQRGHEERSLGDQLLVVGLGGEG